MNIVPKNYKRYSIGNEADLFDNSQNNRDSRLINPSQGLITKKKQLLNLNKEILLKSIALNYK